MLHKLYIFYNYAPNQVVAQKNQPVEKYRNKECGVTVLVNICQLQGMSDTYALHYSCIWQHFIRL